MSTSANSTRNKQYKKSAFDDRNLDITKEEFERFKEALDKEEFRKLFFDYVDEIQDPENRKLYEQEITQFEKERGVEVTFIHPKPGFVIKTSIDGDRKCFVNIASCAEVGAPKNETALNPETGVRGLSWSIPLAQTPARDDIDAKKKRCKVFDVVFHPDALYLSQRNGDFRKCLIETALDAVEREFHVKLDRANLKYPKLEYKGMARPTVIRKLAANPTSEQNEPHPLDHVSPAKPTADSGKPKVLPMKMKSVSQPEFATPKYVVKHCHDVDLAEYTNELDAKMNTTVPRSLLVEIELPLLKSTAECQLDVTSDSIYLLSKQAGAKYRLKLDLPYTVYDKAGNARFDTDQRRLCITLPVVRSNAAKERELHDVLRNFSREDSGVELHSNSESPVEEEDDADTELSDSTEEQTKEANSDDSANATPTATPMHSPRKFLKDSIHYQLPQKFDCNVLDNAISFVLHVRNVQPDSIELLKQPQSLHLQFSSIGSGYYPTHYAFYVQLPSEVDGSCLEIETAEAEAWENNVVLTLNLNVSSEQLESYLAGLHADDLNEQQIHNKIQINSKGVVRHAKPANSPQGPIASNLNVSIERTECDSSISIEIKPNKEFANSSCAVNTTEDDDDESHKKQSKKQRKRNKKRRSLSESACDDIRAIEGMEQQVKQQQSKSAAKDVFHDDEDSSPERNDGVNVNVNNIPKQRKQRSYSECHDSANASSVGSGTGKGILKRFSRYGPRPSISDSCSSIDECHSSYSRSVDAGVNIFSQSFDGIPEEERNDNDNDNDDDDGLSESCKKTVRFNDHIMKQVFRLDSSILGQRKKNQKRRDRKLRALQRRVSEGDSADYEDSHNHKPANDTKYFKTNCDIGDEHDNNKKIAQHDSGLDLSGSHNEDGSGKKPNKKQAKHERDHFESDKNSMIFEMDDDI